MTAVQVGDPVPELSIVIPCYNEVENVAAIVAAVHAEALAHASSHEIVLIDNGSTDGTRPAIEAICAANPAVWAIFNTRNFGQMRSPTHAIYQARGRAVIGMCADFQDPPAMIGAFVRHWRQGAPIVLAQCRRERSGLLLTTARAAAYTLIARVADYPVLPNVTGFGLADRRVIDTLARWNEPEPFFRGMLAETGFAITLLPFDRPERAAGQSKNGVGTLLAFALSGLAGSAKTLLRLPIVLSLTLLVAAPVLLGAGAIANWAGVVPPLIALTMLAVGAGLIPFALLLLFIGLIGDQVRLLTERSRAVPLVIEERRVAGPAGEAL